MTKGSPKRQLRYRAITAAVLVTGTLLLPVTAHSRPMNSGGGTVTATVDYITPSTGVPAILKLCERNVTAAIHGTSALVFNYDTANSSFAGVVELNGTESSNTSCSSYSLGGGKITLNLHGVGAADPNSSFDCDNLTGQFVRVLTDMQLNLTAKKCFVNGLDVGQVGFLTKLQFVPEGEGAGITAPVKRASLTGTITVATV